MKQRFIKIFAIILLIALMATNVFAQTEYKPLKIKKYTSNNKTNYQPLSIKRDSLGSFSSRLSVSTNFIDWALFTPNIGFDIDLGNQELIGAQSLYFNFKYKPDFNYKNNLLSGQTIENLGTLNPFRYWSGRIEYRWHFRWNEHYGQRKGLVKPALGLYGLFVSQDRKSEAMARAMESSQLKRPQMIGGRHYVGIFAEYMDYTLNSKIDIMDRNAIKDGYALMGGISLGYEFPAFYHNRHFWQFHLGGNIGVIYSPYDKYSVDKELKTVSFVENKTKVLPMVTELKFGLTYRKENINRKYWRPSNKAEIVTIAENREMQALIDSITDNYSTQTKIFIVVPKSSDNVSIKNPIEKKDVIKAIKEQTKMPLAAANFVNDTIFPIKRLDDYTITYRFKKALNKYSDELEEYTDVVFKFRVELEGRAEAEKLKQTFVDAIQKYRNEKGIPVIYANSKPKSGDRNEIDGYIPWNDVMTLFSRIWGKTVTMRQFNGVSQRIGVGVTRPVDERGINRRSRYTISMTFHPQVKFNYETDPTLSQFEVQFRGEASGLANYNKINGHRLTFERSYRGGDEFSPEISAKEIADALKKDGIDVSVDNIELSSGLNKFGTRYSAAVYLQAGYVANVSFIVNDKGGLDKAKEDFNKKLNPWIQSRKWPEIVIKGSAVDPSTLDISNEEVIKAFKKASGYDFKDYQFLDYCVDGEYTLMQDKRYRAYAKFQLHRELGTVPKIPYYIRFDNSEAEARARAAEQARREAEELARAEQARREAEERARIEREERERREAEERERLAALAAEEEKKAQEVVEVVPVEENIITQVEEVVSKEEEKKEEVVTEVVTEVEEVNNEAEELARAEQARLEAEALERAERERKEAEERARVEKEERERKEAEEKARREAEERAKAKALEQAQQRAAQQQQTVTNALSNSENLDKAKEDFDTKVMPWIKSKKKWPEIIFRGDPRDPKELNVTPNQIITAFRKASDYVFKAYHFVDFCVDNEYKLMSDGRYQAHAKIQLHSELETVEVEYYIRFAY